MTSLPEIQFYSRRIIYLLQYPAARQWLGNAWTTFCLTLGMFLSLRIILNAAFPVCLICALIILGQSYKAFFEGQTDPRQIYQKARQHHLEAEYMRYGKNHPLPEKIQSVTPKKRKSPSQNSNKRAA